MLDLFGLGERKVARTQYVFSPKEDITVYELARCVELMMIRGSWEFQMERFYSSPETVKRHFRRSID